MYKNTLDLQVYGATRGMHYPIDRYGIGVYVDSDPDSCGADFMIDPADTQGIAIFREFAAKMAAHYKSLNNKP